MPGGSAYEQVAPAACGRCGGTDLTPRGRAGIWDDQFVTGFLYEAECRACQAVWECRADPATCRDRPQTLRWQRCRSAEPRPAGGFQFPVKTVATVVVFMVLQQADGRPLGWGEMFALALVCILLGQAAGLVAYQLEKPRRPPDGPVA